MSVNIILGVVITFIIVFVIYNISTTCNLTGFYIAPKSFLEQSELTTQLFYINKVGGWLNNEHTVYILMQNNNGTLINDVYKCNMSKGGCTFVEDEPSDDKKINNCIPYNVKVDIDIDGNKLTLKDTNDDTVYALLYKDIELSSIKIDDDVDNNTDKKM
jgi:hypothetical protein